MIITSGGIYGFLSGAYQETATKSEFLDKSLVVLQTKQNRFEENKEDLSIEKNQINTTISDLRTSLSNPTQVSYYSEDAGQVITTTSSSARRALQSELESAITDRDRINLKLESIQDSIMKIDTELLDLEINNEEQRELGPLKYLAETTGYPMGQVVNWFLLLIIFVFDPLAIALVVAANFAFMQIESEKEKNSEKDEFEGLGLEGLNRLEKVETLNSKIAKGLHQLDDFNDELRLSGDILNNMKVLLKEFPVSNPKIEQIKKDLDLYDERNKK
jgi:anti-sigma28 factor (negative regulator of flagellin synthesis)